MNKKVLFITALLNALLLSACTQFSMYRLGVKELKVFDEKEYIRTRDELIKQYAGPTYAVASSDSAYQYYFQRLNKGNASKDCAQPIQMLYFKGDSLVSWHINCYAGGLSIFFSGYLNWETEGRFKSFPPKSAGAVSPHSVRLSELMKLYGCTETPTPYTLVFFYTNMLEKQTRHAFKVMVKNIKKYYKGMQPLIILINSDKFLVGSVDF